MADSDYVVSSKSKIREGSVSFNRPNSEAINQQIAANINSLIDSDFYVLSHSHKGYFASNNLFYSAPIYIKTDSDIIYYSWGLASTGSGTLDENVINAWIYDDTGALVNTLFGSTTSRCLISGDSGSRVIVGRDVENSTTFEVNEAGHTIQYGDLNLTTLLAGYSVQFFVESHADNAKSFDFQLRLREV